MEVDVVVDVDVEANGGAQIMEVAFVRASLCCAVMCCVGVLDVMSCHVTLSSYLSKEVDVLFRSGSIGLNALIVVAVVVVVNCEFCPCAELTNLMR